MRYWLGRALGWLGVLWMGVLFLGILAGIGIEFWRSGVMNTTLRVMWWFSPFNVKGWALTIGMAAPGFAMLWVGSKLAPDREKEGE